MISKDLLIHRVDLRRRIVSHSKGTGQVQNTWDTIKKNLPCRISKISYKRLVSNIEDVQQISHRMYVNVQPVRMGTDEMNNVYWGQDSLEFLVKDNHIIFENFEYRIINVTPIYEQQRNKIDHYEIDLLRTE